MIDRAITEKLRWTIANLESAIIQFTTGQTLNQTLQGQPASRDSLAHEALFPV